MCYFIHWPPGGALLRQRHSLINSGPHTGPLSRLFWECRRCTYYNPKLNPNLSSVCGMACSRSSALLSDHFNLYTISVVIIWFCHTSQYSAILLIFPIFISPWAGISHTSALLTPLCFPLYYSK